MAFIEKIKVGRLDYKLIIVNYNWDSACDENDRRIFFNLDNFTSTFLYSLFSQFAYLEIDQEDIIYGFDKNGPKVFIAKAPSCFDVVKELKA